ncbi:hypothetical protein GCM10012285_42590 [Streptomyces kronopolitis]|uniref:Secreted protein n=1 Tax=Streptomyces kronopolitis TaxID=1612435 RepID=A0ABQ2JQY8_9ACTN|nr:hypothetical protein GCM10012285_42590 [Streptomyces kronopolitis]
MFQPLLTVGASAAAGTVAAPKARARAERQVSALDQRSFIRCSLRGEGDSDVLGESFTRSGSQGPTQLTDK